jgi:5-methyltetrahydropteroyltriglutamate--homocysteine methyltransferase
MGRGHHDERHQTRMTGRRDAILTTHAGSLPRPPELARLLIAKERGEAVDMAELEVLGREAVRWAVEKQRAAGIAICGNGEQQRSSFFLYLKGRLSGLGGSWTREGRSDSERYPDFEAIAKRWEGGRAVSHRTGLPKVIGEVRYRDPALAREEARDFRAALGAQDGGFADAFLTAPSPGFLLDTIKNEFYADDDAYLDALARAMQVEYEAVVAEGFILQIDAPDLASRYKLFQDRPLGEFLAFVTRAVAAINQAVARIPRERVRLHVCWGNYEGPHDLDVPLDELSPVLRQAKVGAFVLPFANPRHAHEYRVLPEMLAPDTAVVAGVIDTTTNFIEHPEVVAERLERVAAVVGGPHRVIAGTDCGFGTSIGASRVAADIAWAKLAAMTEGAAIASRRLLGTQTKQTQEAHGRMQ